MPRAACAPVRTLSWRSASRSPHFSAPFAKPPRGGIVVPRSVSNRVFAVAPGGKQAATGIAARLTNRELQVFRLAGHALATRVIAGKLGGSVKMIETHRENIKNKLDLQSHAELVARAAQWLRESGSA